MANYGGRGFYWVMNNLEIECTLPIELTLQTGNKLVIQLDKANSDECAIIQDHIDRTFPKDLIEHGRPPRLPYEFDAVDAISGVLVSEAERVPGSTWTYKPREKKDWRYFVVSYPAESASYFQNLEIVFSLLNIPILLGFNYLSREKGAVSFIGMGLAGPYYKYLTSAYTRPEKVDCDDLTRAVQSVPDIMEMLLNLRLEESPIYRVIRNYSALLQLPYHSSMFTLGLFTILEGIITHKPGGPDTKDSLIHQLRNKMSLLNKRFDIPLNYDKYFTGVVKEVKVWELLYGYRSRLAHGDDVDFGTGKFKVLRNAENVREFMHVVVRTTLRNALSEPDLYLDLSKC